MPDEKDVGSLDANFIKPLVDLWMHQNQIMWSRVQLLIALQGAVLTANYALAHKGASIALCVAAVLASLYLIYIWGLDRLVRDKYRDKLKDYGFEIGLTADERKRLRVDVIAGIRLPPVTNARTSLLTIFWFMIVCDLIVLAVSLCIFVY
jgi:hypothetical protein